MKRGAAHRAVAIAVAVAGAAVVAAYGAERREILGLPGALRTLFDAPAPIEFVPALLRGAAASSTALGVLLACYGAGRAATARWRAPARFGTVVAEACRFAAGTGIGALAVFVAGHLGLLTTEVAVVATAVGLGALATTLWAEWGAFAAWWRLRALEVARDRAAWLPLAVTALALIFPLATAFAPPTARDALAYHLAAPKAYLAAERLVEIPESVHSYLPFNTEMLYTWALLLGPDTATHLVHFGFLLVTLLVLAALATRAAGGVRWGALAAMLFATIPSVAWNAGIAHNEMSMSLYVLLAFVLLADWYVGGEPPVMVWFGITLGLALATKHTALALAPVAAVVVLMRLARIEPDERPPALKTSIAAAALSLGIAAPWYIQNSVRTGNPLYPYFWSLFPTRHPVWDAARAEVFELYLRSTYGTTGNLVRTLLLPWEVSILAVDNVPEYFDGVTGPALLLLAPFAIWALATSRVREAARWRVAGAMVALSFVAWAGQSQQIRFLLPYLAVGCVVCAAGWAPVSRLGRVGAVLGVVVGAVVALNVLTIAASVVAANPFHVALGIESRRSYLARRLPYFAFYELLEREMAPADKVYLVDMQYDTYTLDRPAFSDSVLEHYTLTQIVAGAADAEAIARELRSRGVTHLLVGEDILLNPEYTPFVPEQTRRWMEFLGKFTRRIAGDGRITLYVLKEKEV